MNMMYLIMSILGMYLLQAISQQKMMVMLKYKAVLFVVLN
jgi:hypothetical protein